jgi:hypothetical protein
MISYDWFCRGSAYVFLHFQFEREWTLHKVCIPPGKDENSSGKRNVLSADSYCVFIFVAFRCSMSSLRDSTPVCSMQFCAAFAVLFIRIYVSDKFTVFLN